jgi:phenylacetate-coenzyme A ligase PaaK-like adenylate-forming protein
VPESAGAAEGEIVVTNLVRSAMPVIRYRTGDRGRWVAGACPCGLAARRFELLGRCDDRLNVGGAHLDVGDVGRAVSQVRGLSLFYQTVADHSNGADRLTVRVERDGGGGNGNGSADHAERDALLAKALSGRLLEHSAELRDSVARGWLASPIVEILPAGGLARVARTGKLRRVVDLRR